jgi:hypothetical protein
MRMYVSVSQRVFVSQASFLLEHVFVAHGRNSEHKMQPTYGAGHRTRGLVPSFKNKLVVDLQDVDRERVSGARYGDKQSYFTPTPWAVNMILQDVTCSFSGFILKHIKREMV